MTNHIETITHILTDWRNKHPLRREIDRATWRIDFYSKTEQEYRSGKVKLPELSLRKLIRGAKKKRKQAQADLEYWQEQLKKVA